MTGEEGVEGEMTVDMNLLRVMWMESCFAGARERGDARDSEADGRMNQLVK